MPNLPHRQKALDAPSIPQPETSVRNNDAPKDLDQLPNPTGVDASPTDLPSNTYIPAAYFADAEGEDASQRPLKDASSLTLPQTLDRSNHGPQDSNLLPNSTSVDQTQQTASSDNAYLHMSYFKDTERESLSERHSKEAASSPLPETPARGSNKESAMDDVSDSSSGDVMLLRHSQGNNSAKSPRRDLLSDAVSSPLPETPVRNKDGGPSQQETTNLLQDTASIATPVRLNGDQKMITDDESEGSLPSFATPQRLPPQLLSTNAAAIPPRTVFDSPPSSLDPRGTKLPPSPPRVNTLACRNESDDNKSDLEQQEISSQTSDKYNLGLLGSIFKKNQQPSNNLEAEESKHKSGDEADEETLPDISPKSTQSFEDKFNGEYDGMKSILRKYYKIEVCHMVTIAVVLITAVAILSYGIQKVKAANSLEREYYYGTLEPTEFTTRAPTIPLLPSASPSTSIPTRSPSARPTGLPSELPTPSPSSTPTVMTRERHFQALMLKTDSSVYSKMLNNRRSKHNRAYEWIINDSDYFSYNDRRLIQRWTLALFSLELTVPSPNRRLNWDPLETWMQYTDECLWFTTQYDNKVGCNRIGIFQRLVMSNVGLEGTLPSELALLSNLGEFCLIL
jgi:hypothetical protein